MTESETILTGIKTKNQEDNVIFFFHSGSTVLYIQTSDRLIKTKTTTTMSRHSYYRDTPQQHPHPTTVFRFLLEIFFIVDNDYIPILPTKLSTTYLTYTVYAEKLQSWTNLETLGNLLYTTYFVLFLVLVLNTLKGSFWIYSR